MISGGSNIILEGKKGGLNLKNIKGETISESNLPDYSILASEIQIDDSFYLLLKGTGAKYTGLYSIGMLISLEKKENQWFTETELQANDYESYFNVDANSDNFVGKKQNYQLLEPTTYLLDRME